MFHFDHAFFSFQAAAVRTSFSPMKSTSFSPLKTDVGESSSVAGGISADYTASSDGDAEDGEEEEEGRKTRKSSRKKPVIDV